MADYNVLAVLKAEESGNPLYPQLDKSLSPKLDTGDGPNPAVSEVHGMYILSEQNGKIAIDSGSKDLKAKLWITGERIVVVCSNYDTATWDKYNTVWSLPSLTDFGVEMGFHLTEKAFRRATTIGKALTGHIYFPWISYVGWKPSTGRKEHAAIRLSVERQLEDGQRIRRHLELRFDNDTEARNLARSIVHRVSRWWGNSLVPLTDNEVTAMRELADAPVLEVPQSGMLNRYQVPKHFPVATTTTPIAIARAFAEKKRLEEERSATFRASSASCRPHCQIVEVKAETYECELGVRVQPQRSINPLPGEPILFFANGDAHGAYRVDSVTNHLPGTDGTFAPLFQGQCQILLTDKRLAVVLGNGSSAAGDVRTDDGFVFIAVTPLEKIDRIGITPSRISNRTEPDIFFHSDDTSWGGTWISGTSSEMKRQGHGVAIVREQGDLSRIASKLALGIAAARGLPEPSRRDTPGGFAYDLTETKSPRVDEIIADESA